MVRRAKAVVVGTVVLVVAGACGDDSSKPKPTNTAGSGVEAGQAGMPNEPNPGSGGSAAGETGVVTPVAGSGGDGDAGAPAETMTDVNGQVMAGSKPLAGAIVVVNGIVKVADTEGHFLVRNVTAKYQLMIREPETKFVYVYEGLKTREPRANLGGQPDPSAVVRTATVSGKLLGGGLARPFSNDANKRVTYVSQQPGSTDVDFQDPADTFEVAPQWLGGDSDAGELWALQYLSDFDRGPYEFAGFGRRKVSLTDQGVLGSVDGDAATDITLVDPLDITLATHTELPPGWELDFGSLLYIGPLILRPEITAGDGSVVIPKLDVPLLIETSASGDDGSSIVDVVPPAQGATLDIVHPRAPQLTSPDADATGITSSTEFFWEGMPESSVASATMIVGDWMVFVTTAEGSFKFPDLTPLKVRVPGQITGTWQVGASGPAATVEEAMARDEQILGGAPLPGFVTISAQRDFVTGP